MGLYVPYVIDGSKHSARLFRRAFQKQVGDGSGVDRPGDLKVTALNVPGPGFRVAPGGGVAQSRDTSAAARESYGPELDQELVVSDVPGTGSQSGRRDLVILEITDPEMESKEYAKPTTDEGWQDGDNFVRVTTIPDVDSLVPASLRPVKRLDQITTGEWGNVTGITLAAINWPASTGTITNTMIEDLRIVQAPRVDRVFRPVDLIAKQELTSTAAYPEGATFPSEFNGAAGAIDIPTWATHARIAMTWGSVMFPAGTSAEGTFWVQISQSTNPNKVVTDQGTFDAPPGTRSTWLRAQTVAIPVSMRGTKQWFYPRARLKSAQGANLRPFVDTGSAVVLDVEFFNQPV